VNPHDSLMARVTTRVTDKRVLKLIDVGLFDHAIAASSIS
jgi:hypothetical protein